MDENSRQDIRLAVLIDADNISHHYLQPMMQEIARYGNPTIKRIYGDWTKPNLIGWKNYLLDYAINPVQQFSYTTGKNSTDSALIIDAMDLLYTDTVDSFCLVSSDSDFTRLATRLRESGKTVYGIGEQKTPNAFIASCDRFIYLEILEDEFDDEEQADKPEEKIAKTSRSRQQARTKSSQKERVNGKRKSSKKALEQIDDKFLHLVDQSIRDVEDEDGWAYLGEVGQLLTKKQPSFDARNYGFAKLSSLLLSMDRYEMDYKDVPKSHGKQLFVRLKNDPLRIKKNERSF